MTRVPNGSTRVNRDKPTAGRFAVALMTIALLLVPFVAVAAEEDVPVGLGAAGSFAVLGGETITNTGPTTINGNLGLHPGSEVTGYDEITLNGDAYLVEDEALPAKNALISAYNDAAGRTPTSEPLGTELGGTTVLGGVYSSGSGAFEITGSVTLDAEGDPDTVFIFQMASTLTAQVGSSVVLTNGAQACNVYWQVDSAEIRTNSTFRGTILALTSITLENGASVSGRALARNGSVTMEANTITQVGCAAPEQTTTTVGTAATTTVAVDAFVSPTTMPFPQGAAATGGGSTSGAPDVALIVLGATLLASAAGIAGWRQHSLRRDS